MKCANLTRKLFYLQFVIPYDLYFFLVYYNFHENISNCVREVDTILSEDECDVAAADTNQNGAVFQKSDINGVLKSPPFCTTENGVLCRDDVKLKETIDYGKFNKF